jgi:uncharacterized protein
MDYQSIIDKYYPSENELRRILLVHSRQVADRSLKIAKAHPELRLDEEFLEEAAMLHDIGIFRCDAPGIQCFCTEPYIRHGVIGAELMRQEGWERHALVCERHTGTGLSKRDIEQQQLPLPHQDYMPVALEEQVICYADKFYSKSHLGEEVSIEKIKYNIWKYGHDGYLRWQALEALCK